MDTAAWLEEQIDAHSPERDHDPAAATRLAEAYAAFAGADAQAFGLAIPADIANRDALRTRSLEMLKKWLATFDAEQKERIKLQLAGYGIHPREAGQGRAAIELGQAAIITLRQVLANLPEGLLGHVVVIQQPLSGVRERHLDL